MSATTGITRSTVVSQELRIDVNLGDLPDAAKLDKIRVIRKADNVELFLNLKDYDPDPKSGALHTGLHFQVVENYDPDEGRQPIVPVDVCSMYTEDDMGVMTIAQLKGLPEFTRVSLQERGRLNGKSDYINAVLSKRSPHEVPAEPASTTRRGKNKRESLGQ